MPFSKPSTILALTSIPLQKIMAFSSCYDTDAQTIIAQGIERIYGLEGLRSLWLCQGFQCSKPDTSGCPPATQWWMAASNPFSQRIKKDFLSVATTEDANTLLGLAARSPSLMSVHKNGTMLLPDDCIDTKSLLWAVNVRRLAQSFFPHIPEVASPFNDLYFHSYEATIVDESDSPLEHSQWEFIYPNPVGAFMDDTNALKYFAACNRPPALPENPPQWLVDFYKNGDTEWNIYKGLGLPMEDAYALAMRSAVSAECIALPDFLDIPVCPPQS